jgi:carbamoylphosphate synthase small subunit
VEIEVEQRRFRHPIAADIPAIGISLGAQILASALGGQTSRPWPSQIGLAEGAVADRKNGPLSAPSKGANPEV